MAIIPPCFCRDNAVCPCASTRRAFKTDTKLTRIRIEYLEILTRKHSHEPSKTLQSTANNICVCIQKKNIPKTISLAFCPMDDD